MKNILAALTAALAFVFNARAVIKALRQQVADLTAQNAQLHILAEKAGNTAELDALRTERDRLAADHAKTLADVEALTSKAKDLADAVNDDQEIPLEVDHTAGTIVLPAADPSDPSEPAPTVPTPLPAKPVDTRKVTFATGPAAGSSYNVADAPDGTRELFDNQDAEFAVTIAGANYTVMRDPDGNFNATLVVTEDAPKNAPPGDPITGPLIPGPVVPESLQPEQPATATTGEVQKPAEGSGAQASTGQVPDADAQPAADQNDAVASGEPAPNAADSSK